MHVNNLPSFGAPANGPNLPSSESVLGKEDFLRLLTTQLSNQDPLNPMEGSDFSAQLAQFSSVEQLFNIEAVLQESLQTNYLLASSINNTMAATVIGKEVRAIGDEIQLNGEDPVNMQFDLFGSAKEVKIEILDEDGSVVHTIELNNLDKGENNYEWDGKDSDGNLLSSGNYRFRVEATDNDGEAVPVTTFMTGTITGVRYGSAGPVLILGDTEIRLADVYEILLP